VSTPVAPVWRWTCFVLACVGFLVIVFARGGPNPAETDAHAVTLPTSAIARGDLRLAEEQTLVPNPPGYPLLMAPVVKVLGSVLGSARWCDDKPIPAALRGPGAAYFRSILSPCSPALAVAHRPRYPLWYRSQAVLTVLAFVVLLAGALVLLRSAGRGGGVGEMGLALALLVLPGTTDAVAQSFHPQDLMSVGFACAGAGLALRRRTVAAGVAFGLAFLCKQFAVLALVAVVATAPGWRDRLRIAVPAAVVVAAGVLPFYVVAPTATVHALSAVYVSGAGLEKTPTAVGLLAVPEQTKLELARDLPVAAAVGVGVVLWARGRRRRVGPVPVVGAVLACLALRLVFEVTILDYYFLAVGAMLLVLDFCLARPPLWAAGWIVLTRYGLTWVAPRAPLTLTAVLFLLASLAALARGLVALSGAPEAPALSAAPRW